MPETVYELNGTSLTVKPEGQLDSMTSPAFEEDLLRHLEGVSHLTVDFEKLDYISSAGLRALLVVSRTLEERGADMIIIHASDPIKEIFEMVGFSDLIPIE